jgi:hypothetical protein
MSLDVKYDDTDGAIVFHKGRIFNVEKVGDDGDYEIRNSQGNRLTVTGSLEEALTWVEDWTEKQVE